MASPIARNVLGLGLTANVLAFHALRGFPVGARGPAPTPTKVLEARGSWRAKLNSKEPRPEPGSPTCPKELGDAEKKVWKALCRILADMGLASKADGAMIERYCRFFVRWRKCEEFIAKNGMTYPVKCPGDRNGGPPKSGYVGELRVEGRPIEYLIGWEEYPQLRESHRLHKSLKDVEDRFGLTPAARTRVQSMSENGPRLHNGEETGGDSSESYFFGG